MTDEVFFSTISDLNARLKKHEFSTVELVKAFGARLETLGLKYNALALPLTKVALERAKTIDGELKRERYRGPLQGIPFGAKDLLQDIRQRGARSPTQRRSSARRRPYCRNSMQPDRCCSGNFPWWNWRAVADIEWPERR